MAQFMGVPGPSQEEFDALSGRVTALNSKFICNFSSSTEVYTQQYYTSDSYTITTDGWYEIVNELHESDSSSNVTLRILINNIRVETIVTQLRFDNAHAFLYLKAGSVVSFTTNTELKCNSHVVRIS